MMDCIKWLAALRSSMVCGLTLALVACGGGGSANPAIMADAVGQKISPDANSNASSAVVLPIEVLGAPGTEVSVSFKLPPQDASGASNLWLQTHNVRYPEKASVKVNDAAWVALSNVTAEMLGTSKIYGGIGGSFSTLQMQLPLAPGVMKAGVNTLRFRFDAGNGLTIGYRVLALNVLDATGAKLLPASSFTLTDPANFVAPRPGASDVAAGAQIWAQAELKTNSLPHAATLRARCADCHTATGRDLQYFGYSNKAIVERAKFHGLSPTQGEQVASYIRSLPVRAVGRPWNPPYQPGRGTSSKPLDEWAAGAGIGQVLDNDWHTINHLFPEGINRDAVMTGNAFKRLETHDIAIAFQLPDWNHWLPEVHPYDAYGKPEFEAMRMNRIYEATRAQLIGRTPAQITQWFRDSINSESGQLNAKGYFAFREWYDHDNGSGGSKGILERLYPPSANGVPHLENSKKLYSAALWRMVKLFELQEEFALTGLGREVGPNANQFGFEARHGLPRAWVGVERTVFDSSPFLMGLDQNVTGSSSGNNHFNHLYLSNAWYQLQLILNPGHKLGWGHRVIDWGYAYNFLRDFDRMTGVTQQGTGLTTQAGRNVLWALKGMDEADNGTGPNRPRGWSFRRAQMAALGLDHGYTVSKFWLTAPTPQARQVLSTLHQVWLEKNATWLPVQYWYDNLDPSKPLYYEEDGGWFEAPSFVLGSYPANAEVSRSFAEGTKLSLIDLKRHSALVPALQNGYAAWAQAIWPGFDSAAAPRNNWLQHAVARVGVAPAAPTVSGGAAPASVNVSWQAQALAQSHNVKRAESANGPYLTVAYLRTGTSYSESVPLTGRTYHYRITSNTAAGESPDSAAVVAVR